MQILFLLQSSLQLPLFILCIHSEGLMGRCMDFVSLLSMCYLLVCYQFSSIEFYEPNTMPQEVHIKILAWFFTSNVTALVQHCSQLSPLACSWACFLIWMCFSCHFLWLLTMTQGSFLRDGTLLLAVHQTFIHTSQVCLQR